MSRMSCTNCSGEGRVGGNLVCAACNGQGWRLAFGPLTRANAELARQRDELRYQCETVRRKVLAVASAIEGKFERQARELRAAVSKLGRV